MRSGRGAFLVLFIIVSLWASKAHRHGLRRVRTLLCLLIVFLLHHLLCLFFFNKWLLLLGWHVLPNLLFGGSLFASYSISVCSIACKSCAVIQVILVVISLVKAMRATLSHLVFLVISSVDQSFDACHGGRRVIWIVIYCLSFVASSVTLVQLLVAGRIAWMRWSLITSWDV